MKSCDLLMSFALMTDPPEPRDTATIYTDNVVILESGRILEEFHFGYIGEVNNLIIRVGLHITSYMGGASLFFFIFQG